MPDIYTGCNEYDNQYVLDDYGLNLPVLDRGVPLEALVEYGARDAADQYPVLSPIYRPTGVPDNLPGSLQPLNRSFCIRPMVMIP